MIRELLRALRSKALETPGLPTTISSAHPNGHFYSPVTNPAELRERQAELWPQTPRPCLGFDFNDENHERVLDEVFPRFIADYDYPEHEAGPTTFFTRNSQFSWLDSRALFVLLRELQPGRLVEIGSGFSSLLTADVNHRFMNDRMDFTCIEPYPRDFLKEKIPGLSRLIVKKVESVELEFFSDLSAGDVLFVDSSHVAKTGSDVNYIFFEILPRLPAGVLIHVHDIFLPFEYPPEWAIDENRSWNEQYLLRALLMDSAAYRVFFGCKYAEHAHHERVSRALALPGGRVLGGASFWFEKTA